MDNLFYGNQVEGSPIGFGVYGIKGDTFVANTVKGCSDKAFDISDTRPAKPTTVKKFVKSVLTQVAAGIAANLLTPR
jgi:hypothetical protein